MLFTQGNESLTKTQAQELAQAAYDFEYPLNHMESTPIEDTAPITIDLENDPDVLLYGH